MSIAPRQGAIGDLVIGVGVFAVTFLYRFNNLGGAFGGFSNDEFGYLSRARQIQAGEVPFRDFNDPGWFLTDCLSAAAQWLGGYSLWSQAVLTTGMISLAAALTYVLARRAAGSVLAALLAIAVHVALEPRPYNYPKLVLYAGALLLAWRYADRPTTLRLAALGGFIGLAFLFRHDHLLYLGVLLLATVGFVHRHSLRDAVRDVAVGAAAASVLIVPFLGFLAANGGVVEYFRVALVYAQRDAERTSFDLPAFSLDQGWPLLGFVDDESNVRAAINVRWAPISDDVRRQREARYGLKNPSHVDETTWTYELSDQSSSNIRSLVEDPGVEDTHGIDRARFVVSGGVASRRLVSFVDSQGNAIAFLYYSFLLLPVVAAAFLVAAMRRDGSFTVLTRPSHLGPVIVLALLLDIGFLSRGATNVRLPDVAVVVAVLLAWITAVVMTRDGRILLPRVVPRLFARAAVATLLVFTLLSVNTLGQTVRHIEESGLIAGNTGPIERFQSVASSLREHPSTFTHAPDQPAVLRLAAYVRSCTAPGDRLFVLAEHPELYYFSDRLIAGGHAWLLPLYYSDPRDEARIVERLRAYRVPVVITESRGTYVSAYQPTFEQVDAYLAARYREAGEVEIGSARALRVLVDRSQEAAGMYEPLGLPCFATAQSANG